MSHPASDQVGAWRAALDAFESSLVRCEAALDADVESPEYEPFAPPLVVGPVPHELTVRALELLEQAAALKTRLEDAQAEIRRDLARLPRARMQGGPVAASFEAHA